MLFQKAGNKNKGDRYMEFLMWIWLAAIVGFIIFEASTCQLVSIWFAAGALGAFVTAAFGAPLFAQCVIFVIVSGATMLALRPFIKKKIIPAKTVDGVDRLVGMTAIVKDPINQIRGAVNVDGKLWNARTDGEGIQVGETCMILELDKNRMLLKVTKMESGAEANEMH
jgi:membrane protein implicated in regulation of membrane protease activity